MQLDRTSIVIRERTVSEILDLALQVLRVHFRPLLITMVLGVLPFVLLNELLTGWMMHFDADFVDVEEIGLRVVRYMWTMALLITIEAPLATMLVTVWLGQMVFLERPSLRQVWRDAFAVLPRHLWTVGVLRGAIPAMLLAAVMGRGSYSGAEFLLVILVGGVCFLRAVRPCVGEIVLLERLPLVRKDSSDLTIARRNALLHMPSGGTLIYHWLVSAAYAVLLSAALFAAMPTLRGILWDRWALHPLLIEIGWPLALWVVAWFMTVVRFLGYLDLRIRHEGWEVELRLRAEAARQMASMTEGGRRAPVG